MLPVLPYSSAVCAGVTRIAVGLWGVVASGHEMYWVNLSEKCVPHVGTCTHWWLAWDCVALCSQPSKHHHHRLALQCVCLYCYQGNVDRRFVRPPRSAMRTGMCARKDVWLQPAVWLCGRLHCPSLGWDVPFTLMHVNLCLLHHYAAASKALTAQEGKALMAICTFTCLVGYQQQ